MRACLLLAMPHQGLAMPIAILVAWAKVYTGRCENLFDDFCGSIYIIKG